MQQRMLVTKSYITETLGLGQSSHLYYNRDLWDTIFPYPLYNNQTTGEEVLKRLELREWKTQPGFYSSEGDYLNTILFKINDDYVWMPYGDWQYMDIFCKTHVLTDWQYLDGRVLNTATLVLTGNKKIKKEHYEYI